MISRRLIINLTQSQDKAGDVAHLEQVVSILEEFPGKDEVSLRVANGLKVTHLKLPHLTVGYSPELHEKLTRLVGDEGVSIETS
jgi:hypothetical protein